MNEKLYWFWFTYLLGITRKKQGQLLERIYHPKELFSMESHPAEDLFSKEQYERFLHSRDVDTIKRRFECMKQMEISYVLWKEKEYPLRLKDLYDYPYGIFIRGTYKEPPFAIGVVGTRRPSLYGKEISQRFAKWLSMHGVQIVSGLARGIDGTAHKNALCGSGKTVAVLGCGIDMVYPKEHKKLYDAVWEQGCIISEYGPGIAPLKHHFPERNRLISGLSDGIVVVEARAKSGSLITADCALEQNKEVFAVPGNVTSPTSVGCNRIIQQGAKLVEIPEEIMEEFSKFEEISKKVCQFSLDEEEKKVYDVLDLQPRHIDDILSETSQTLSQVTVSLFSLEQKGLISQIINHYYIKNN